MKTIGTRKGNKFIGGKFNASNKKLKIANIALR